MPPILRELIAAFAALFAGAAAVSVVADAVTGNWVQNAVRPQPHEWLSGSETGVVIAAISAVVVCAWTARLGSRRTAWVLVTAFAAVVVAATLLPRSVHGVDFLTAMQLVRAVTAGGVLGATAAAVTGRAPAQRAALIAGTVTSFAFACSRLGTSHRFASVADGSPAIYLKALMRSDPLWWLVLGTLALAIAAAWTTKAGYRLQRPAVHTARVAVISAITLALANRLLGEWVRHQHSAHRVIDWVVVGVAIAIVLAVVGLAASAVSPVDGRFLLAATGLTAAIFPAVIDISMPQRSIATSVLVTVSVVSPVVGARIAMARKHPVAGLVVAAAVALVTAIEPDFGDDGAALAVRLAVLCLAAGYALASTFPAEAPFAALGLGIPCTAMVFAASTALGSAHHDASDHRLAAISMLIVVVLCTAGVLTLRQRPEQPA